CTAAPLPSPLGRRRDDALERDAEIDDQVGLSVVVSLAAADGRERAGGERREIESRGRIELRRGGPGENVVRRRWLVAVQRGGPDRVGVSRQLLERERVG